MFHVSRRAAVFAVCLFCAAPAFASGAADPVPANPAPTTKTPLLEELEAKLLTEQSVHVLSDINPELVPPHMLEELGREVMARMVGDEQWHARMNEMMGGEGSDELAAVHRSLAVSYIERNGVLPRWNHRMMAPGMLAAHGDRRFPPPMFIASRLRGAYWWLIAGAALLVTLALALPAYRRRKRR